MRVILTAVLPGFVRFPHGLNDVTVVRALVNG